MLAFTDVEQLHNSSPALLKNLATYCWSASSLGKQVPRYATSALGLTGAPSNAACNKGQAVSCNAFKKAADPCSSSLVMRKDDRMPAASWPDFFPTRLANKFEKHNAWNNTVSDWRALVSHR